MNKEETFNCRKYLQHCNGKMIAKVNIINLDISTESGPNLED